MENTNSKRGEIGRCRLLEFWSCNRVELNSDFYNLGINLWECTRLSWSFEWLVSEGRCKNKNPESTLHTTHEKLKSPANTCDPCRFNHAEWSIHLIIRCHLKCDMISSICKWYWPMKGFFQAWYSSTRIMRSHEECM